MYCLCDQDLFGDEDCRDCDYDESILLTYPSAVPTKRTKIEVVDDAVAEEEAPQLINVASVPTGNSFLMDYPEIIHPLYKDYCGDWKNSENEVEERNKMIIVRRFLIQEKNECVRNRTRVEHNWHGSYTYYGPKGEEEEIMDICLELAHDYYGCGYRKFKSDYDSLNFYPHGRLIQGNLKKKMGGQEVVVGEVFDCVSPDREIEGIIDKFIKAIAIVEKWETEDNFLDAWDRNVFNRVADGSDDRFVYLGWQMNKYLGWNTPDLSEVERYHLVKMGEFQQFNYRSLSKFWQVAWRTVRALLIMDCINQWAIDFVRDPDDVEPFDFGVDEDE